MFNKEKQTYYFDDRFMCDTDTRLKFKFYFVNPENNQTQRCVVPSNFYFIHQSLNIGKKYLETVKGKFVKLEIEDFINDTTHRFKRLPKDGGHLEYQLYTKLGVEG